MECGIPCRGDSFPCHGRTPGPVIPRRKQNRRSFHLAANFGAERSLSAQAFMNCSRVIGFPNWRRKDIRQHRAILIFPARRMALRSKLPITGPKKTTTARGHDRDRLAERPRRKSPHRRAIFAACQGPRASPSCHPKSSLSEFRFAGRATQSSVIRWELERRAHRRQPVHPSTSE